MRRCADGGPRRRLMLGLWVAALASATQGCRDEGPAPPPPALVWPNEPPGLTVIADQMWRTQYSPPWYHENRASWSHIVPDAAVPSPFPWVLEHVYPAGFPGGLEPAVNWRHLADARTLYVGFWWRASGSWQGHPVINKLIFVTQADEGGWPVSHAIVGFGDSPVNDATHPITGPWTVRVALEFAASNGHLPYSTGDDPGTRNLFGPSDALIHQGDGWHQIELLMVRSTGVATGDGIVRWWLDSRLAGDYTGVNFDQRPLYEFQVAPTWGGLGEVKTTNDYLRFGPVRLSAAPDVPD